MLTTCPNNTKELSFHLCQVLQLLSHAAFFVQPHGILPEPVKLCTTSKVFTYGLSSLSISEVCLKKHAVFCALKSIIDYLPNFLSFHLSLNVFSSNMGRCKGRFFYISISLWPTVALKFSLQLRLSHQYHVLSDYFLDSLWNFILLCLQLCVVLPNLDTEVHEVAFIWIISFFELSPIVCLNQFQLSQFTTSACIFFLFFSILLLQAWKCSPSVICYSNIVICNCT